MDNRKLSFRNILQVVLAFIVVITTAFFFYSQFMKNWDQVNTFNFNVTWYYVVISFALMVVSFLIETYIWQICVNDYVQKKLRFTESLALLNTSALLKYIPGRIWSYTAQIAMMSSRGISKSLLIYVNAICFLCFAVVSGVYGFCYYFFVIKVTFLSISISILALFIIVDFAFVKWNTSIINRLIVVINMLFKREIEPIKMRKLLIFSIQLLYLFDYMFMGMSMYFLSQGLGMAVSLSSIIAIAATISISSLLGHIVFISPAGLGVREGTMFVMLKQFSSIEAALILPIATRLVLITIDVLLGGIGIWIGIKYRYYSMHMNR
jgi:glycosyltransferase 2 family protein